tara:strand:+ start:510 stop:785 length:276 start_codon:yes stop_codon:yes gene_type:complete
MTAREMVELIQQHHPHIGQKELIGLLNRAMQSFCQETEIVQDSFATTTVANQRHYGLDSKIIKIKTVTLNDVEIPRAIGLPPVDDTTGTES